jgi:hypothetical protein
MSQINELKEFLSCFLAQEELAESWHKHPEAYRHETKLAESVPRLNTQAENNGSLSQLSADSPSKRK